MLLEMPILFISYYILLYLSFILYIQVPLLVVVQGRTVFQFKSTFIRIKRINCLILLLYILHIIE